MRSQLAVLTALVALAALASCGDGTDTTSTDQPADDDLETDEPTDDPVSGTGMGMVRVHIEQVEGVFVEGFEVGLRIETPAGEVLTSTLWTDFADPIFAA